MYVYSYTKLARLSIRVPELGAVSGANEQKDTRTWLLE
jgi:hypothetical protein